MPPWAEKDEDRKFPPPEFAAKKDGGGQGHAPVCGQGIGERPLTDDDLNKASMPFVKMGRKSKAMANGGRTCSITHLKRNPNSTTTRGPGCISLLVHRLSTMAQQKPYEDMRWCKDYDWKLGKDDCSYALRKLYKSCTTDRAKKLNGGEYTYRCVTYKFWAVNTRN
ncbi:hypothetical protein BKA66DRAFT_564870 [Pyrenochaeta sp. MPI-SDFR-AT-0127]|nr:hypothetical protein BKA66DRAFT_564870 [Pyrenochaeta sp. MPI-SDFR-AT-0127]